MVRERLAGLLNGQRVKMKIAFGDMKTFISFFAAFSTFAAYATLFRVSCDQPDACYRLGEDAIFTVEATESDGSAPKGNVHIQLDNFGSRIFEERDVDLARGARFTVTGRMAEERLRRARR